MGLRPSGHRGLTGAGHWGVVVSTGFGVRHTQVRPSSHKLGAPRSLCLLLCKANGNGLPPRTGSEFEKAHTRGHTAWLQG